MWSFSVLSAKSGVAFWSHRVKSVEPAFSGHDIAVRVTGLRDISCLEPRTDLGDGKRKPITSHPRWDEHLQSRCPMEMVCVVWRGKAQLPVHALCQVAALCSWWPATRGTACSYSKNLHFFIHLLCSFSLNSVSFSARTMFCYGNALLEITRFENALNL